MATLENRIKDRIANNELAIGLGLRFSRTPDIGRILATAGFDFAFIDMEHSSLTLEKASELSIACHDAGVTPLVRVPGYEHWLASRVLDTGAMGVVFPHVDTPELARELVSYCKFPPLGHRSAAGSPVQLGYQPLPMAESSELINRQTLVVVMLESPQAIENADAIAAVEGVDVLLIGTNDLCMEMGIPQQFGDARVDAAMKATVEACKKHGKIPGFGGVYDEEHAPRYIDMGMRFILSGGDLNYVIAGANQRARFLRGLKV